MFKSELNRYAVIRDLAAAIPHKLEKAGMNPDYIIALLDSRIEELRKAEAAKVGVTCAFCGK
jgi:hypothetical protein